MNDEATLQRLMVAQAISDAIRGLCWSLNETPSERTAKATGAASNNLRELLVNATPMFCDRGDGVVLDCDRETESVCYLFQPFCDGGLSSIKTFKAVRDARAGDIDWTDARRTCREFSLALSRFELFSIWCRSLREGLTVQAAKTAIIRERDLELAGCREQNDASDPTDIVEDHSAAVTKIFPGQKDSPSATLCRVVHKLRADHGLTESKTRCVLRHELRHLLPTCKDGTSKAETSTEYPSKKVQDNWIKKFERYMQLPNGVVDGDFRDWENILAKISAMISSEPKHEEKNEVAEIINDFRPMQIDSI